MLSKLSESCRELSNCTPRHSAVEVLVLTVTLLADLYVTDVEVDEHTVLFVLRSLIMIVAQRPIQPQSEPVTLPTAEDGTCVILQPRQAGILGPAGAQVGSQGTVSPVPSVVTSSLSMHPLKRGRDLCLAQPLYPAGLTHSTGSINALNAE